MSYKNRAGDLTVELETEEICDQLKDIVVHRSDEIIINIAREIRHSATIVGQLGSSKSIAKRKC